MPLSSARPSSRQIQPQKFLAFKFSNIKPRIKRHEFNQQKVGDVQIKESSAYGM
jgi:hypothetical protein